MQSPVVAVCAGYTRNTMASRGPLRPDPDFRCARCLGTARPIDGRTVKEVKVDREKLEAVSRVLLSRGHALCWRWFRAGCCNTLQMWWGQFCQLLSLLSDHNLLLVNKGRVYLTCVRSVMLHVAETWVMTTATLNRLPRNDNALIRWICNVKAKDEVSSDPLFLNLGIQSRDAVWR